MPFNIDTFKSSIENDGYLKNSHFQVGFVPPILLGINSNVSNMIRFRTDSFTAPGINILAADINRYGVGPSQKQPYNVAFNEASIGVLVDQNGDLYNMWNEWIRRIFEHSGQASTQIPSYSVEYKDNYSTTIQIIMFDQTGEPVKTIDLFQAFPLTISNVPLNWSDNSLVKLNINLTYASYTIT